MKTRKVDVKITKPDGEIVFQKDQFEVPEFWSDHAATIMASKYATNGENSALEVIDRVAKRITQWGIEQDYFERTNNYPDSCLYDATDCTCCNTNCEEYSEESRQFLLDLTEILTYQRAAPNTPSWINLNAKGHDEAVAACFLGNVEDNLDDILKHVERAGKIFQAGSGIGINISKIRAKDEALSNHGFASGPVSFHRMWDKCAGAVKSGGRSRRSAVLVGMEVDHPDIEEFIACKSHEEEKANKLIASGVSPEEAYSTVDFQNANHSVIISDDFMQAVKNDLDWDLINRTDKKIRKTVKARELFRTIAKQAHATGDPGLQFTDTINEFNPIPNEGRIETSNPCQPGFATVLTPEGIRTFDDIDIGSVIWSGKRWTKVINKVFTGSKSVNKYITTAGQFIGTENHRVFSNGERVEVKDAQSIDICNCEKFGIRTIDSQAIVDGWVLGDGSIHKASNNLVYLNLGKDDIDTFINNYGDYYLKDRTKLSKYAHEVETTIKPCELVYTYEREIPVRYIQADDVTKASFLRGLYNANGSVCGDRVTLKSTSFKLISDVQIMLSSLGISSYFTTNKKKKVKFDNGIYECKESYDLNITKDRDLFSELIHFDHKHKYQKLKSIIGKKKGKPKTTYDIIRVEELGEFKVYDITVEAEEHSYWTGGLLVSNCGEIYGIPYTACNLFSINILNYLENKEINFHLLEKDLNVIVRAMDITIDPSYYATDEFRKVAHETRPLGIGISNLGALLMTMGIPYGSEEGRAIANEIYTFVSATSYEISSDLASDFGPCDVYENNKDEICDVIHKLLPHSSYLLERIKKEGLRNTQVTTAQPSGTCGMVMDCDSYGIEPLFALKTYKNLIGGGTLELVPKCVENAWNDYGYKDKTIEEGLKESGDLGVNEIFATANEISWKDHIDMMAAIQSATSSGISKTINMPNNSTVEDIEAAYMYAWEQGLKGITIYRDGCKMMQPLTAKKEEKTEEPKVQKADDDIQSINPSARLKPSDEREALTLKIEVGGHEGYVHAGMYPDGSLCELFIRMSKEGSMVSGMMDSFATAVSLGLQHGVPLSKLVEKFKNTSFEPSGWVTHDDINHVTSIVDYIFQWLELRFIKDKEDEENEYEEYMTDKDPVVIKAKKMISEMKPYEKEYAEQMIKVMTQPDDDQNMKYDKKGDSGPPCTNCGTITQKIGSCFLCSACGTNTGCS